ADAGVAFLQRANATLALVLNIGQLEFFAEDLGEFVQRDVHFDGVLPFVLARLASAIPFLRIALSDGISDLAFALARPTPLLIAIDEPRNVDLRDRDGDDVLALSPQHLPLRDVLAKVLADPASNDLAKSRMVPIDLQRHACWPSELMRP